MDKEKFFHENFETMEIYGHKTVKEILAQKLAKAKRSLNQLEIKRNEAARELEWLENAIKYTKKSIEDIEGHGKPQVVLHLDGKRITMDELEDTFKND